MSNEFDVWYANMPAKEKKILERFSFGLIASGESRGKKSILFDLDIWNGLNQEGKAYSDLDKYIKSRTKELVGGKTQ
jgi:hypothetical protein